MAMLAVIMPVVMVMVMCMVVAVMRMVIMARLGQCFVQHYRIVAHHAKVGARFAPGRERIGIQRSQSAGSSLQKVAE